MVWLHIYVTDIVADTLPSNNKASTSLNSSSESCVQKMQSLTCFLGPAWWIVGQESRAVLNQGALRNLC